MAGINPPANFDSNRRKFKPYWAQMQLYLNTFGGDMSDGQKIAFVLSDLSQNKGFAESWGRLYLKSVEDKNSEQPNFGKATFADFSKKLEEEFMPKFSDRYRALSELDKIQQGNKTAQSHVDAFTELVCEAEIQPKSDTDESSHLILIRYFLKSLHPVLRSAIFNLSGHQQIQDYYRKAIQMDSDYRDVCRVIRGYDSGSENGGDSTTMSGQERNRLMRRGDCFNCKVHGHIAKDCSNRSGL